MRGRGGARVALILVWLLLWSGADGAIFLTSLARSNADPCGAAELFTIDNTEAGVTIAQYGATVTGSTPLDGVYWSSALQRVATERSREFHLCSPDAPTLHTAAEALRGRLDQESVLTFDYLPRHDPGANAVIVTVPGIDIARFRDAFLADSVAHDRLLGGSVTNDHALILVAGDDDLDLAHRLVEEAGGDWAGARIAYGKREFVKEQ